MIAGILRAGKVKIIAAAAALLIFTSLLDWLLGKNVSLAALYILPVITAAIVLRPVGIVAVAFLCSYLRWQFEASASPAEMILRFIFAMLAYVLSGLVDRPDPQS